MITKYKPNLDAQMREHEMPEYKGKWKNCHFLKSGGTRYGDMTHDSKEAAQKRMAIAMSKLPELPLRTVCGRNVNIKEYAFTIQIPVES